MSKEVDVRSGEGWISGFAEFLRSQTEVEAILVDSDQKKLSVATLGPVDLDLLKKKLAETLSSIESSEAFAKAGLHGISLTRVKGDTTLLEKPTCPTAPVFWQWREMPWPEVVIEEEDEEDWRVLAALAGLCAVFGLAGYFYELVSGSSWISTALYIAAMVCGGFDAATDVFKKLPKGQLDIHFLMLAVAFGASFIGAFSEGALLLFLFSFSGALENFALHRTKKAIDSLFKVAPKSACVLTSSGEEKEVPVDQVEVGSIILVRPGDLFPLDGEVVEGKSAADESTLTGEANPVEKSLGDALYGGTINLWGVIKCKVTKPANESALQKIIRLIQDAQNMKAPSQRFTDKFGTHYTLIILSITFLMFFVWWLGFDILPFKNLEGSYSSFYRAMTLLVVASPCALVLSIPSAILAAIAWGATHGILFRGGAAIEKLADVDLVALDKTGTLTTGELTVAKVESFPEGRELEVAKLAYALERNANHPIARAIVKYGKAENLEAVEVGEFESLLGFGVQGKLNEARCLLGRRELLEYGPLKEWTEDLPQPSAEYTEVWVVYEDLIGRLLLKDRIREESKPVLAKLKDLGMRTVMLTGDRREAAESIAESLGIQEVCAGLKPEDKVNIIKEFSETHKVAMVGDGVNDAPSLAASYVPVGMGARGTDAALEQSEVVLMNDRIDNFLEAYWLSLRSKGIIRQNLIISLGTIVIMVCAAILGLVPIAVGVVAHEGSTVLVCLNSLRLLFSKPQGGLT